MVPSSQETNESLQHISKKIAIAKQKLFQIKAKRNELKNAETESSDDILTKLDE